MKKYLRLICLLIFTLIAWFDYAYFDYLNEQHKTLGIILFFIMIILFLIWALTAPNIFKKIKARYKFCNKVQIFILILLFVFDIYILGEIDLFKKLIWGIGFVLVNVIVWNLVFKNFKNDNQC